MAAMRPVYATARLLPGVSAASKRGPQPFTARYGVGDARCSGASAHACLTMIAVRGRGADCSRG